MLLGNCKDYECDVCTKVHGGHLGGGGEGGEIKLLVVLEIVIVIDHLHHQNIARVTDFTVVIVVEKLTLGKQS